MKTTFLVLGQLCKMRVGYCKTILVPKVHVVVTIPPRPLQPMHRGKYVPNKQHPIK